MTDHAFGHKLQVILDKQVRIARHLRDVLERELAALQSRNEDDIETLARTKQALMDEMESTDRLRSVLLRQHNGSANTTKPMQDLIAACDASQRPGLETLHQQLKDLIAECQQRNQSNGVLVNAGLQYAHRILSVLHGMDQGQPAEELYDRNGKSERNSAGHSLTKA